MLCKAPDSQEEMKVSRDEFAVLSNTLNTLSRTMLEALDTEITHKDGDWRDDQPVQTLHLQPGLLVLQPGGEDLPHVSTVGLEAEPHGVSDVGDLRSPLFSLLVRLLGLVQNEDLLLNTNTPGATTHSSRTTSLAWSRRAGMCWSWTKLCVETSCF